MRMRCFVPQHDRTEFIFFFIASNYSKLTKSKHSDLSSWKDLFDVIDSIQYKRFHQSEWDVSYLNMTSRSLYFSKKHLTIQSFYNKQTLRSVILEGSLRCDRQHTIQKFLPKRVRCFVPQHDKSEFVFR